MLGNGDFGGPGTQWIFTTNWDLCLKHWFDYALRDIPTEDGTVRSSHGEPVFSPEGWSTAGSSVSRKIIPLHGSYSLIRRFNMIRGGSYEEIHKLTNAGRYYDGNPSELAKAFIIFPLEAVGYEQSVRSPYLDMHNLLKLRLKSEHNVFIIGFSLRDPTVASIFEEILRERARKGDWQPIDHKKTKLTSKDTDLYKSFSLKIFLIDSSPKTTIRYLKEHGYLNPANALIPIKTTFPNVMKYKNSEVEQLKIDLGKLFTNLLDEFLKFGLEIELGNVQHGINQTGLEFRFPIR